MTDTQASDPQVPVAAPAVLIVGTGAMASLFAGYLARSGQVAVTMAGSWPAGLEALQQRGVIVEDEAGTWSAPVSVLSFEAGLPTVGVPSYGARVPPAGHPTPVPFPLALVLVKSYQTAAAARRLQPLLAPGGLAISLQNGLGNDRRLARFLGRCRVNLGVTDCGATLIEPGRVRVGGLGITVLAACGVGRSPATEATDRVFGKSAPPRNDPTGTGLVWALADWLTAAGLEVEVLEDIRAAVWRKLAVNCAINANAALRGVVNGALLEDRVARASLCRAAREVGDVAAAGGVRLPGDPALAAIEVARRTAGNRCSMLQDLARGMPTEVDALNGAVVQLARRHGVPTPENERLWRAVRLAERRARQGAWPGRQRASRGSVEAGPAAAGADGADAWRPERATTGATGLGQALSTRAAGATRRGGLSWLSK